MNRILSLLVTGSVLLLIGVNVASAWWVKGHETVTEAGVSGLPDDIPAFFRAGGKQLAHCSGDPDRWKNQACKFSRSGTAPDHFIDLEDFDDNELPNDRYKAISLLIKLNREPDKVGMLPWAMMEYYDRLTCAFADYRADKENPAIRAKCLVYAGNLAHLTGDCSMPLHTTRNYDGKKGDGGKVVQKGIHAKIDAFPEKFGLTSEEIGRDLKANNIEDVWKHVLKVIKESHQFVEKCYELDAAGAFDKPTEESRKFILERCRFGAQLTMDLWYSAWVRSAKLPAHY